MEAKLIRERVAQYIKDRRFINEYECPVCGGLVLKSKQNAAKGARCGPCRNTTHGLKSHPLYSTWDSMHRRCSNTRHSSFHNYGGRGIAVCEEWRDVAKFIAWAQSSGWKPGLEIDRIDVDADYCPENCRFVTRQENTQNKRSTKLSPDIVKAMRIMANLGESHASIAKQFDVSPTTVHGVVNRLRWANVK